MTTPDLPLRRIVLYKHGVGHFEREGHIEGDATIALTFKQSEVSDVLKSLTVLDLDGGAVDGRAAGRAGCARGLRRRRDGPAHPTIESPA